MLWLFNLYNPVPDKSLDDFVRFERRIIQRYAEFFKTLGSYYMGVYHVQSLGVPGSTTPWGDIGFTRADVYAVDAGSPQEAQARIEAAPQPQDIDDIIAECRTFIDPQKRTSLWLEPIVISPHAQSKFSLADRLFHLMMYRPLPDKTLDDFIRFERRIIARYTEYMMEIDWAYLGVYQVHGLEEPWRADVNSIHASSPEEIYALDAARDAANGVPEDIDAIITECRSFMNRENERYNLWLKPIVLSSLVESGVILAPNALAV